MKQLAGDGDQSTPGERREVAEEKPEEGLPVEFTTIDSGPARSLSPATQIQKHSLHGLFTGLPPEGARQRTAAKSGPPQRFPDSLPVRIRSIRHSLGVELSSLAKHYEVEMCVAAVVGDRDNIFMIGKHGLDFKLEQRNAESSSGFKFFRHHVNRELPIIILDASKEPDLESHPLVAGSPAIAFYAAAPFLVGASAYGGTLSICDSRPRHHFTLQDCEVLQQIASRVAALVGRMP